MISMKPIIEPDVLSLLNNDRFDGPLQAYTITDGKSYLGHCLFVVDGDVVIVLDAQADGTENTVPDYSVLDGAIRASVSNGQNQGATKFKILKTTTALAKWQVVFCKSKSDEIPIDELFGHCEHEH